MGPSRTVIGCCVTAVLFGGTTLAPHGQTPAAFHHPGLLSDASELSTIASHLQAGDEPWTTAFSKVPSFAAHRPEPVVEYRDGAGHTGDRYDVNQQRLTADAEAAYGSALRWVLTQDAAAATEAIDILDAWSATLRRIDERDDGPLSTSYGWPSLIYAAELIRSSEAGWDLDRQRRFERVLREIVWPATQRAVDKDNGNNWRSFGLLCRLAIAVYTDDRARFDQVIDALERQIPHYLYPDGQSLETPRDLWHVQMGIAPLVAAAEIAWHQDVDLYARDHNRLLVGAEWHIPFGLGETAGWPRTFSSTESKYRGSPTPDGAGRIWPFYEMLAHHYRGRRGLDAPNTERLLRRAVEPEPWERTGGWGTLTHASPRLSAQSR
jgi:hypothetical protein